MSKLVDKIKKSIIESKKSPTEKEFDRLLKMIFSVKQYDKEIRKIRPHRHFKVLEIEEEILKSLEENPDVFVFQNRDGWNLGMYAAGYWLDEVVKKYVTDERVNRQTDEAWIGIGQRVLYGCYNKELVKLVVDNKLHIFQTVNTNNYLAFTRLMDEGYQSQIREIYPDFDMFEYEKEVLEYEKHLEQQETKSQESNTPIEIEQDIVESENDGQDFE